MSATTKPQTPSTEASPRRRLSGLRRLGATAVTVLAVSVGGVGALSPATAQAAGVHDARPSNVAVLTTTPTPTTTAVGGGKKNV